MGANDLRILVGIAYGMELARKKDVTKDNLDDDCGTEIRFSSKSYSPISYYLKMAGNGRVELIANDETIRGYVIAELNICTPWTVLISQLAEVIKIYDESMKED